MSAPSAGVPKMRAIDLMSSEVFAINASESIAAAKNLLIKHRVGRIPVVDKGKIVGILTEEGLADAFTKARDPVDTVCVSKVMGKRMASVKPNDTVTAVAKKILQSPNGCVIVSDDGAMGIITKTDLVRYFAKHHAGEWTVADVMTGKVRTIGVGHSMFRAARDMVEHSVSRLVVDDRGPVGIVTSRDIALASYGMAPHWIVMHRQKGQGRSTRVYPLTVADVMKTDLAVIPPKSDAASAAKLMLEKRIGSVVVMQRNQLKGIVTRTDLVRMLAE